MGDLVLVFLLSIFITDYWYNLLFKKGYDSWSSKSSDRLGDEVIPPLSFESTFSHHLVLG